MKRFRRDRHLGGHRIDDLNAYLCPRCKFWHLGRDTDRIRERAKTVTAGEIRKMKNRLEDQGRAIIKDTDRENRKRLVELAPIVAEDRLWLMAMQDAAEYHLACAEALNRMLDEYWRARLIVS